MDVVKIGIWEQLSNREIAIVFWLLVFFVWIMIFTKNNRRTAPLLFRTFLKRPILVVLFLTALYIFGIVTLLSRLELWNLEASLKDTIIWTVTVAVGMVFSTRAWREDTFFRSALLSTVKITVVIEFVANAYSFSLPWELLLAPFLVFLGALLAIAETQPEHVKLAKPIRGIVALIGFVILWHSMREFIINWPKLDQTELLATLFLPSILTIAFLPFVYLLALYAMYESTFVRLKNRNRNQDVIRFAKWQILFAFGLSLRQLSEWSKRNPNLEVNSKAEVLELLSKRVHSSYL